MLIIFEGNEGSGKTTLAGMLSTMLCTPVMKRASHKGWTRGSDDYAYAWDLNESAKWEYRFLFEMLNDHWRRDNFIIDRSFITQEVYHKAFWDNNLINDVQEQAYSGNIQALSNIPHLIVHVNRDTVREDDETLKTYAHKGDPFEKIQESYERFYDRGDVGALLNVMQLDNNRSLQETFNELKLAIEACL
jgi:thymidylate kinase